MPITNSLSAESNYYTGIKYPSPFFDLSSTYLPDNISDLYQWCEMYFLTNPLVNAVINKLSVYPVTDVIIEHAERDVKTKWESYDKEVIDSRTFSIKVGWEYWTFGSAYVSVQFPFVKELKCPSCGKWMSAEKSRKNWKFTNLKFNLQCPYCSSKGTAQVRDVYLTNIKKVRLVSWNPKQVSVSFNEITGESNYYYKPTRTMVNDLTLGLKDVVAHTPQYIIEAVKSPDKSLMINKNNLYHLKRPSLASKYAGYGTPLVLPVLKDLFYLQTLKKAQEAIAQEHIIPLRAVFPQAPTQSSDPIATLNLDVWRKEVKAELTNWKRDPNYMPVLGFPLGTQNIGGDGRALLLAQEIQTWSEMIVAGMGVPQELIFGGTSWSGTNVSLRMLEVQFLNYRTQLEHMLNFVFHKLADYTGWPLATARFRPFKMADDLQRKMLLLQMNQAGKISDTTLLEDCDLDSKNEDMLMQEEAERRTIILKSQQKASAEMQGESMVIQAKYQQRIQEMQMEQMGQQGMPPQQGVPQEGGQQGPPQGGNPSMGASDVANRIADQISGAAPPDATRFMAALKSKHPDLAAVVEGLVAQKVTSLEQGSAGAPLPEQLPPRRAGASV